MNHGTIDFGAKLPSISISFGLITYPPLLIYYRIRGANSNENPPFKWHLVCVKNHNKQEKRGEVWKLVFNSPLLSI